MNIISGICGEHVKQSIIGTFDQFEKEIEDVYEDIDLKCTPCNGNDWLYSVDGKDVNKASYESLIYKGLSYGCIVYSTPIIDGSFLIRYDYQNELPIYLFFDGEHILVKNSPLMEDQTKDKFIRIDNYNDPSVIVDNILKYLINNDPYGLTFIPVIVLLGDYDTITQKEIDIMNNTYLSWACIQGEYYHELHHVLESFLPNIANRAHIVLATNNIDLCIAAISHTTAKTFAFMDDGLKVVTDPFGFYSVNSTLKKKESLWDELWYAV